MLFLIKVYEFKVFYKIMIIIIMILSKIIFLSTFAITSSLKFLIITFLFILTHKPRRS